MKKINVLFCSDANYIVHLTVAVKSLLDNNVSSFTSIHIITGQAEDPRWINLEEIVSKYKYTKLYFHTIKDKLICNLKTNHHFKLSNYYRLFSQELIFEDKVLYLDADLIVNNDITDLFNINLKDNLLAAVENPGFNRHKSLQMDCESKYFNSGVMLMNLSLWRKKDILNKVVEFVSINPDVVEFVDQCGLNAVIDGKWLMLEPKYNQQSTFFDTDKTKLCCFSADELIQSIDNPVIVHYTGQSKPWHLRNKHPFKSLYWKYRKMTPFKTYFADDFSTLNLFKYFIMDIFMGFIKNRK